MYVTKISHPLAADWLTLGHWNTHACVRLSHKNKSCFCLFFFWMINWQTVQPSSTWWFTNCLFWALVVFVIIRTETPLTVTNQWQGLRSTLYQLSRLRLFSVTIKKHHVLGVSVDFKVTFSWISNFLLQSWHRFYWTVWKMITLSTWSKYLRALNYHTGIMVP